MAFLSTSLGTPPLCIRGGVSYEQQTLIPDSGLYNFALPYLNNWSFPNSLRFQNARIKGTYSLEDNFEQGYFNFESWSGNTTYSTNGIKSGYQSIVNGSGGAPYLANFWGIGESAVSRTALEKYGFSGETPKPKNITTCNVMSGVNTGTTGTYPDMRIYMGSIPSGNITVYGRIGSVNPFYSYNDKILSFDAPQVIAGGGTPATTSYLFPGTAADNATVGTDTWGSVDGIKVDDGFGAVILMMGTNSHYLLGTNFGFTLGGYTITSIEAEIDYQAPSSSPAESEIRLFHGGVPVGTNKSTGTVITSGTRTYTWSAGEFGGLTGTQVSESTFGLALSIYGASLPSLSVDYFKIRINYTIPDEGGTILVGSLSLINTGSTGNRKLNWVTSGFGDNTVVDMPTHRVTSTEFSNFLLSYSAATGIGSFYTSYDDEPLALENVVYLGDISTAFAGETIFYEKSYSEAGGSIINNPKIVSDFGISNRAWTQTEINEFNNARVNGAYWITESPAMYSPSPSGSDTTSLNFHFPVNSSGLLGSCSSGDPRAINYYVPLNSGVNDRLYEFDRSKFNGTALTLDFWASNTGTNPSGNVGARIDFCSRSGFFSRELYTPTHYWSGFPVSIPSGVSQIRMSGLVYNSRNGLSDLSEVSKNNSNNAQLYLGAWYNNIGRNYNGDIRVYSTKIGLDGYVTAPVATGQLSLFCSGYQHTSESLDLTLHNSHINNSVDLFIEGNAPGSGNIPLYISGGFAQSNIDLYLSGKDSQNESVDLYIEGGTVRAEMPLYIYSEIPPQGSGDISLFMYSTDNPSTHNDIHLFIGENSPSGVTSAGMNLMLQGPLSIRTTAGMNMFLGSEISKTNNNLSLFCGNYYSGHSGSITMFLKSKSGTLGAIPASSNMNLYLNRATESVAHNMTLFISGPESTLNNIPLVMTGANKSNNSIPLYTDGVGVSHETLKLYTHGF